MVAITTTQNADLINAATLNSLIYELIADKTDIRGLVWYTDDPTGSGSNVVKIPQVAFDEVMSSPSEGSSVANSTLGDGTASATVVRHALRYDRTDLMALIQGGMMTNDRLAAGIAMSAVRRAAGLIMTQIATAAATVGTTGVDLSVDTVLSAQFTLMEANVSGMPACVLEGHQFTEFINSLRGESGALGTGPGAGDTREMIRMSDMGFKGPWNGIQFWVSDQVTDDATDYFGGMWVMGGIAGAEASPVLSNAEIPASQFLAAARPDSSIWVEFERDASAGLTELVGNYYAGFILNEDAKCVQLQSVM